VRLLRERGIPFASLAFGERPSPQVGVVLTSWRDSVQGGVPQEVPMVVVPVDSDGVEDVEGGVLAAVRVLEGSDRFVELVIGVDPGRRPGLAVLGDGRVVHTAHAVSEEEAAGLVERALGQFEADRAVVRVGHGSPKERDRILDRVGRLVARGVRVEVVDETGTTPPRGSARGLPLDVVAAIGIARTPGRPAFLVAGRRPSEREVRHLQEESRKASGGRFSISRAAARRVARGDLTLTEAVEAALRRRRNPPGSR
jgi:hypothetical protein